MADNNGLVRTLFDGPLDIVGDIHGEYGALKDLLRHLGYSAAGEHPAGRRLAFIGDLGDRGEDSPAVIGFVRQLVERDLAQCVLGNHELNLLRGEHKEGNGWFYADNHDHRKNKFLESRGATPEQREAFLPFIEALPLALERPDLRLVHACWDVPFMALLRESRSGILDLYRAEATIARAKIAASGLEAKASQEMSKYGSLLSERDANVPLLESVGRIDEIKQMNNRVSLVTSGPERLASKTFYASNKWRMVDRVKWWNEYPDEVPVIIGHYWRWATAQARNEFSRGEHDLFEGLATNRWHGRGDKVYCADFGVGARYKERANGTLQGFQSRLGAVRWPEQELVFDSGERQRLV